jgi:hypothetical protein
MPASIGPELSYMPNFFISGYLQKFSKKTLIYARGVTKLGHLMVLIYIYLQYIR